MLGEPISVTIEADMDQILECIVDLEKPDTSYDAPLLMPDWIINKQAGFTLVLLSLVWLQSTNRIIIVRSHPDGKRPCSKSNPTRITFVAVKLGLGEDGQTEHEFFSTGLMSPVITDEDNLYEYDKPIAAELLQLVMAQNPTKP